MVSNRIQERTNDLAVVKRVIDQKTARIAQFRNHPRLADSEQAAADGGSGALHAAFSTYAQRFMKAAPAQRRPVQRPGAQPATFEPTEAAFPKQA